MDCAIFTPNPDRLNHIQVIVAAYKAAGRHPLRSTVLPAISDGGHTGQKSDRGKNIPCLRIETDYSMEDVGQLKKRVEAFVEQLR